MRGLYLVTPDWDDTDKLVALPRKRSRAGRPYCSIAIKQRVKHYAANNHLPYWRFAEEKTYR